MNIGEISQSIENLAYIRGANNLRDASDAKVAFVEKLLWQELVTVMTEAIKSAPEPEKESAALKQYANGAAHGSPTIRPGQSTALSVKRSSRMLKILISVRNDLKGRAYMRELELELKERGIPYKGYKTDKRVRIIMEV